MMQGRSLIVPVPYDTLFIENTNNKIGIMNQAINIVKPSGRKYQSPSTQD